MVMNEVTMENGHDYIALSWVKQEILVNLDQLQLLLEGLSNNPENLAEFTSCYALIHQVNGALSMLGYSSASLFTKEMERLCNTLANSNTKDIRENLQILVQAALQLPTYIEIIQTEGHDIPIALLPIINEMRVVSKIAPLTEIELFSSQLDNPGSSLSNDELQELGKEGLGNLLRKLRHSLQLSLINIIQDQEVDQAFSHLFKIFNYLNRLCKTTAIAELWFICIALIEGLANKSIANTAEIKDLLKLLDQPLKNITLKGFSAMNVPASDALIQRLLFQIAKAQIDTPYIAEVKQRYQLKQSIADIKSVDTRATQFTLSKLDPKTLDSLAIVLTEEFTNIKDYLDLLTRSKHQTTDDLDKLINAFKQISNILEVLGFTQQKQIIEQQLDLLHHMVSKGHVEPNQFIDLASSILTIEAVITTIRHGQYDLSFSAKGILTNAQFSVITEIQNDLIKIKDIISIFSSTHGKEGNITELCSLLKQAAKSLIFISLNKAAAIIICCEKYIEHKTVSNNILAINSDADALVCTIASLDYYLECLIKNQNISSKDALNFAVKYLDELGFSLPDDYENIIKQIDTNADQAALPPSEINSEQPQNIPAINTQKDIIKKYSITLPENISQDINPEFAEIFVEEAYELLDSLAITFPQWLSNNNDIDTLLKIRRSFHTMKGSGRTVKAIIIGELSWAVENMLNRVIDHSIDANTQVLQLTQEVIELLPELLEEFLHNQQCQRDDVDNLATRAQTLAISKIVDHNTDDSGSELTEESNFVDTAIKNNRFEDYPTTDKPDEEYSLEIPNTNHQKVILSAIAENDNTIQIASVEDNNSDILPDTLESSPLSIENLLDGFEPQIISLPDNIAIDPEIAEVFIEEMNETLELLAINLPQWAINLNDHKALKEIRRSFHTIKGSGRTVNAVIIGELGWFIEDMLNRVLDKSITATEQVLQVIEDTTQLLPELIKEFGNNAQRSREDVNKLATIAYHISHSAGMTVPAEREEAQDTTEELSPSIIKEEIAQQTGNTLEYDIIEESPKTIESTPVLSEPASILDDVIDLELTPTTQNNTIEELPVEPVEYLDIDLLDIFIAEAKNHLNTLENFITDAPLQVTNSLQRAMHTLKGSALMAGINSIASLAKPFESFLKECHINDWLLEKNDFELLEEAYTLLSNGIQQLEKHSLEPIEGTNELLSKIIERRQSILTDMQEEQSDVNIEAKSLSELSNQILASMDLLLDAEDYIEEWEKSPEIQPQELSQIYTELKAVSSISTQANIPPIVTLSNALISCYAQIKEHIVIVDDALFDALLNAHSALLSMADQLAAAQTIDDHPDIIEQLNNLSAMTSNLQNNTEEPQTIPQKVSEQYATSNVSATTLEENISIYPSDKVDADMVDVFLEEADEILIQIKEDLSNWIKEKNPESLQALQRQLHTLKGSARVSGILSIGDLAHGIEFIYEGIINKLYIYSEDVATLLFKVHDTIQLLIDNLHDNQPLVFDHSLLKSLQLYKETGRVILAKPRIVKQQQTTTKSRLDSLVTPSSPLSIDDLVAELTRSNAITSDASSIAVSTTNHSDLTTSNTALLTTDDLAPEKENLNPALINTVSEIITEKPSNVIVTHHEPAEQVKVSAELLDSLVNLAGETSIYRSRVEQQVNDLASALFEINSTIDRVNDQLRRLDIETQAQIISKHRSDTRNNTTYMDFDPLEMDQYSQIQQLSRSLFESASDLQDIRETLIRRSRDMETLLQQQARVNTALQENLMRTRMVPLDRILPRLRRLVRQTSSELGKKLELIIGNAVGEIDRSVIDALVAPLEHMIRNSADHGIESKNIRLSNGKSDTGHIYLELNREGGEMVLTLRDDGAGINIGNVRDKAIAKGLMNSNDYLSDHEIIQFILSPGFSTAQQITQISGRGVGLDVVVNAIKQLGGILTIDSTQGLGTTFTIRLPINLSVSRALMIRVNDENYAIPMSTIEGVTNITVEQLQEFQQFETPELEYGDEIYQVKYIGDLLGIPSTQYSSANLTGKLPILLVRSGKDRIALRVDELLTSNEIVLKNLGPQFLSVPAISGATILGDGKVIIILDLVALMRSYLANQNKNQKHIDPMATSQEPVKHMPLVMVVDDSVTVRKVTTRLLERQGMSVITARDGLEAVTLLEDKIPDIILLDIEMPRMDGFEVASRVRHNDATKQIPIIMITSRSGDKFKERAFSLGVNEYMSKPFIDANLLATISNLLPHFKKNIAELN